MKKIPLWGKITGGCFSIILLFVLIAGCAGIISAATSDPVASTEPVASQEESPSEETTAPEPVEEETTPEETAEPEDSPAEETTEPETEAVEEEEPVETEAPVEEETADPTTTEEVEEEATPAPHELPINMCIPDQEEIFATTVAGFTYSDVTIYTDQVYVVMLSEDSMEAYLVAGTDQGTMIFYLSDDAGLLMAANLAAHSNTELPYPEEIGQEPLDLWSDEFKLAESCVA